MKSVSESRAENVACELLAIRGWKTERPPKGNLLWKNEYRNYPHLLEALQGKGKLNKGGDAYPDFLVVERSTLQPIIVGETKARDGDIGLAIKEACTPYGDAFDALGMSVLAAGIAGDDHGNIAVQIKKRGRQGWMPVKYRQEPIQWIPTPLEAELLIADRQLFELEPRVPSNEILAKRGEEMNRILRECSIKDALRPAVIGAFMLALWFSKGEIRTSPSHVLKDINDECKKAFVKAGKPDIAASILTPEDNKKLAAKAARICHILRLLNITTLTSEHDYIGQLYEMFFRFTGGNTIGQFFTPRHIASFITDLVQVTKRDLVVDPTCGTGGFLISSLQRMTEGRPLTSKQLNDIVRDHLMGFEDEPVTAALCVTNMILRGDGTTGIVPADCFTDPQYPEGKASIVVGNPPFPHRKTDKPVEEFIGRGLEALSIRGSLAMIVPSSLIAKGESGKKNWRKKVLKENSLRGVITFPSDVFQPYASATTGVVILQKGVPHSANTRTFFCRIENDGFRLKKNVRVEQSGSQLPIALEAWVDGTAIPGFCTTTSVPGFQSGIEWAPGAYIEFVEHATETLESEIDGLIRSISAFLVYHAPQVSLLNREIQDGTLTATNYADLSKRKSRVSSDVPDTIGKLFDVYYGQKALHNKENLQPGNSLIISSAGTQNGCYGFFAYKELIEPPFVTVPSTGSIGEAFVQTMPCGVTDDCLLLIPKGDTSIDDLFIAAAIIRLERWRFDYGRKITPERIQNMKIPRNKLLKNWIANRRSPLESLLPGVVNALGGQINSEDLCDAEIARTRLAGLREPGQLVRGAELEKKMKRWAS